MIPWIIVLIFCYGITAEKCHRIRNGQTEWFCCNNHELKGGSCIECEDGFKAVDGLPCEPCPLGLWGRKCRGRCDDCQNNQRCDRVRGCVTLSMTSSNADYTTIIMESRNPDHTNTFDVKTENIQTKLLPREMMIYTSGVIVFLMVSVVCATCFCFKERIVKFFQKTAPEQPPVQDEENQIDSHYISLDEINMNTPNLNRPINNTVNAEPINNEDIVQNTNDEWSVVHVHHGENIQIPPTSTVVNQSTNGGYLHPCSHAISDQNSDDSKSSSDSGEGDNDSSNQDKGYLHPYQPVVQYSDRHLYDHQTPTDTILDKHIEPEKQTTPTDTISDKYNVPEKRTESTSNSGSTINPTYN